MNRAEIIFRLIRESEKRTWTKKEWVRFVQSICETKEQARCLANYLHKTYMTEYMVVLTEKGKARVKE